MSTAVAEKTETAGKSRGHWSTLEKLIKEALEAANDAGVPYYKAAGELLNEAREGYFENDAQSFTGGLKNILEY